MTKLIRLVVKKANLEELIAAAKQYVHDDNSDMNEVTGFISLASLDSSGDTNAPIKSKRTTYDHPLSQRFGISQCVFNRHGRGFIPFKAI